MNTLLKFGIIAATAITIYSCKKETCTECHYDKGTEEIELGEKCGDELEQVEASGITVDSVHYEVHCHGH